MQKKFCHNLKIFYSAFQGENLVCDEGICAIIALCCRLIMNHVSLFWSNLIYYSKMH